MEELVRFGVSISDSLLNEFDKMIDEKGYKSRSEAIRDIIRVSLISEAIKENTICYGTITLIFDHHVRELSAKLTEYQHKYFKNIVSNLHVHIDHDNCLEVIVVHGRSDELKSLSNQMIGIKGVKHGKLVLTSLVKE